MRTAMPQRNRAFSLVELVIVVVIIGIIAAIAVPRISRGARGAGDSALRGDLAALRNAVDMYAAEHGGTFPAQDGLPATLLNQLTEKTDGQGNVGTDPATHIYGPYLRGNFFPPLKVCANKGSRDVKVVTAAIDPAVDIGGPEGWIYSAATGEIIANCAATEEDEQGAKYNEY